MPVSSSIEITIRHTIDLTVAEKVVSRIRSAMRNDIETIILIFEPEAMIRSAEFLAFLASSHDYLKERSRTLLIKGANEKNISLLKISKLDHLLEG